MPIQVVLGLIIVVACSCMALGLMAGHAIGYSKAEKIGRRRLNLYKFYQENS